MQYQYDPTHLYTGGRTRVATARHRRLSMPTAAHQPTDALNETTSYAYDWTTKHHDHHFPRMAASDDAA